MVVVCVALALSAGVASVAAAGGNSDSAKLCQSGWQSWLRADGTPFTNQGECVSYTAHGGILTTFTTSTSSHTTLTRVDQSIQVFQTRVLAVTDTFVEAYDQTVSAAPGSAETNAAFEAARQALVAALVVESTTPPNNGVGVIQTLPPSLVSSTQASQTVVSTRLDHVQTSTTTTTTLGPATIFIGPNQSEAFTVLPGTQNINTNTHTESFVTETHQTTVTNAATYLLTGSFVPASG
jgi:hypothetical protein